MVNKVIYTCVVGGYDNLLQPLAIDDTYDYICFSNDIKEAKIGVWNIRDIPFECDDNILLSRYSKLLPHEVLGDYDYSVWIDANIQVTNGDFYKIIDSKISTGGKIFQVNHIFPPCDCAYEEVKYAYMLVRCSFLDAARQCIHLKKEGFPHHWGLFENNIILRKHNDPLVRKISVEWWQELCKYAKRDQFSLMYVYWKNNYRPELLFSPDQNARNVDFLEWNHHSILPKKSLNYRVKRRLRSVFKYILFLFD